MQELAGRFRGAGLQIFRHRRGMLFVSPIRLKAIDETAVSDSVRQILETLKASPRINRKELAEKLIAPETDAAEAEKTKLSLASELHWMIREGHVIEFNDGSLDLPRAKPPKKEAAENAAPLSDVPAPDVAAAAGRVGVPVPNDNQTPPPPGTLSHQEQTEDVSPATEESETATVLPETTPTKAVIPSGVEGSRGETSS